MLFGNEFSFLMEGLNKKLLIGNKHGVVPEGLEQGHCAIHGAIFVLVSEDVVSISRLWVVVSDISHVFLKKEFQVSAGLTNIS
jgi:hypothetical protein